MRETDLDRAGAQPSIASARRPASPWRASASAFVVGFLMMMASTHGHAAEVKHQRMLLAPGVYTMLPSGHYDADAFCLDESLAAPLPGDPLSNAPASLGEAVVTVEGASPLSLQAAVDQHVIQVEGLGGLDYSHVRIMNLSSTKNVQVIVKTPSVLAERKDSPMEDLQKFYPKIIETLSVKSAKSADVMHADLQKELWTAFEAQMEAGADRGVSALTSPYSKGLPAAVPDPSACLGNTRTSMICLGR
jgi:hypothetical protein